MKNIGRRGERKDVVPESQLFIGGKNFLCFSALVIAKLSICYTKMLVFIAHDRKNCRLFRHTL